jgi:hypothetical protein
VSIEDEARDLLRRALRDTAPDPERDAAGRAFFGGTYLPPGEAPPAGIGGMDSSFRQIASVAFRGGWHAARELPARPPSPRAGVLAEVLRERAAQDAKWGEQNHPDGTGPLLPWPLSQLRAETARDMIRDAVDDDARTGRSTWRLILLEEVAEALAEDDPAALRRELVQVAAIATQWAEAIDRRPAGRCPCGGDHGPDAHDSAQALDEDDDRRTER